MTFVKFLQNLMQLFLQGTTHLLVGGSSTPNSVPAFLSSTLPQISTTLLALDISANFLASLSPSLASCTSLEELNISSNPLRALPVFLAELTALRVLIADSTGIATVPNPLSALEKLHTLSIRRNKMHSLPSWLCTLPCLESLLVDGNPFQGPWKALVEPLLAKAPMTPAYPPSTPLFPQLSASAISTTTNTDTETSDAEDLTDHEDPNTSPRPQASPPSAPSDSRFALNVDEEHTITPANAKLLGRSVTSPVPRSSSPLPPRPLSRTRTTPSRHFRDRDHADSTSTVTYAPDADTDATMVPPSSFIQTRARDSGALRRMHSADELRRAMQSPSGPSQPETTSPPRPQLKHYATASNAGSLTSEQTVVDESMSQARRYASLGIHSRGPSRAASRTALASSMWGETVDEDGDADVESPPRPASRASRVVPMSRRERGTRADDVEQVARQSVALPKAKSSEKEKSGRKWGFLKKMSMGKLRNIDGGSSSSSPRPAISHGHMASVSGKSSATATPSRRLSPPQLEVNFHTSDVSLPSSMPSFAAPPASPNPPSLSPAPSQKPSTELLKIPPTPSSSSLLSPPTPSPRSASSKRRSFLPIDGPLVLNIPIPSTAPFLPGITVANGSEDAEETSRVPSPVVETAEELQRKEEEKAREANARALRSVMAYLKDMNDLTMLSQGSVMSMYGNLAPMDRARRPTLADSARSQSETSMDSLDSASTQTTSSGHMNSFESMAGNRSVSTNATMSIATTDSGDSGEERKYKDDKGRRMMIIREIIECVPISLLRIVTTDRETQNRAHVRESPPRARRHLRSACRSTCQYHWQRQRVFLQRECRSSI